MKQRPRIYYTESQKKLMWDRWQQGDLRPSLTFNKLLHDRPATISTIRILDNCGCFHTVRVVCSPRHSRKLTTQSVATVRHPMCD